MSTIQDTETTTTKETTATEERATVAKARKHLLTLRTSPEKVETRGKHVTLHNMPRIAVESAEGGRWSENDPIARRIKAQFVGSILIYPGFVKAVKEDGRLSYDLAEWAAPAFGEGGMSKEDKIAALRKKLAELEASL